MTVVVADPSPLNYLALIGQIEVLVTPRYWRIKASRRFLPSTILPDG